MGKSQGHWHILLLCAHKDNSSDNKLILVQVLEMPNSFQLPKPPYHLLTP